MNKSDLTLYSWNVNGIRAAARKGFFDWLSRCRGDIVSVQEVRASQQQIDEILPARLRWHSHFISAERKGYSGVGMFSRARADLVQNGLGKPEFDREGRLQMAEFGNLKVVNGYFPNGNGTNRDNSRVPYKLRFYRRLFRALKPDFDANRPIIVMGDFNTAHQDIDLARPGPNRKTSGFLPEERRELDRWISSGWCDTFRKFEPSPGHYSWWSQRQGVREKNVGWRIDYILASPGAIPYLKNARIHPFVYGSDHCPISVTLDSAITNTPSR